MSDKRYETTESGISTPKVTTSRRQFLTQAFAAGANKVIDTSIEAVAKNPKIAVGLIAGGLLLMGSKAKEAKACHFESGPHRCDGRCPNEWVGDVVVSAFTYLEKKKGPAYDKFDKDVDEIWGTLPNGGRKMRLTLWGCDVEPTTTIWHSPENGNGRAFIEGTGIDTLRVRKHGAVENWNWRKGKDKRTGEVTDIAFVRGQIDRYAQNGVDIHREINPNHPNFGQLSRWQICIDICPEDVMPVEKTDVYVASGFSADEITKRGLVKRNGMYVPEYASQVFDRVPDDK